MNANERPELYDLQADPQERHNIAEEEPALASELAARLRSRLLEGKWQR